MSFISVEPVFHVNLGVKPVWCFNLLGMSNLLFSSAICLCFGQALEDAAANAAEEERRRLQTQTELQDRYRNDLEREKMVHGGCPWSSSNETQCRSKLGGKGNLDVTVLV